MNRLFFSAILFLSVSSSAQINLGTIKDIYNSELGQKVKGEVLNKLEDMRSDFDESSFNYAVALSDNAGLFESEERFKKNKRILLDGIAATQGKEVSNEDKALSLNSTGEFMYASNQYNAAESSFKQAKKILEEAHDSSDAFYAQVISNMGLLYHTLGRYTLAEKFELKARALREKVAGKQSAVYASSLNNLAVLYKDMGRFKEAEELIDKAVSITQVTLGKQNVFHALSLNNQAMIFYSVGRSKEAEELLTLALEIAGKTLKDKSTNYVRLLTNLALMYQDLGKYSEAEAIYLKAIKIREGKLSPHHPDYAHLLNTLASLYVLMGKTKEVESNLKKAADIYKKKLGNKHPAYASTISNLGNFYRVNNKNAEAEPLLAEAFAIREEVLGKQHPDYLTSMENMALLYWQTGKLTESTHLIKTVASKSMEYIQSYFPSFSEGEKERLWDKTKPRFHRFNAFAVSQAKRDPSLVLDMYNYQLTTKAMLLNSTNRIREQILQGKDKQLKEKYAEWLDQKEELAHAYTLSKEQLKEEKIDIDLLEKLANQQEKELSANALFNEAYKKKTIQARDIVNVLGSNEAAIEIIQLNKFDRMLTDSVYYATLILKKESPQPILLLNKQGSHLNKKFYGYYRNCVQRKVADEVSYYKFWQAIDDQIKTKKTVYVSLDGVYNQINLNTLMNANGRYVLQEKDIILVTNTKEIIELKKTASSSKNANSATLVGFPNYGDKGTVAALPGTQKEVESIKATLGAKQYQVRYLIKSEATEANVKKTKPSKILHFATHGFFLPEPEKEDQDDKVFGIASNRAKENPMLRAGLLLANAEKAIEGKAENGILTAYEVTNLQLAGTEIAVLSACETGLGDVKNGEGVYGLQRAFQVAGVNTIIMSLWKVSDEATQTLMSSFYKKYLASGNKFTAFKEAQSELKTKYKEPYYWGAFVLVE